MRFFCFFFSLVGVDSSWSSSGFGSNALYDSLWRINDNFCNAGRKKKKEETEQKEKKCNDKLTSSLAVADFPHHAHIIPAGVGFSSAAVEKVLFSNVFV